MSLIDTRRAALNAGEAALLPALPRIRGAGSAALRSALQAAAAMGEKRLSDSVSTSASWENREEAPPVPADYGQPYQAMQSRAALHHALKR